MITTRTAIALDAPSMTALLNEIIQQGGTTAMTKPIATQDLADWMADEQDKSAWQVALDDKEKIVGFQWIAPKAGLPADACDIATFVQVGQTGLGIGSKLFAQTEAAAKSQGYRWINATIRADNSGGLTYYQSRGFRDYGIKEGTVLASGLVVDRILKRYDL